MDKLNGHFFFFFSVLFLQEPAYSQLYVYHHRSLYSTVGVIVNHGPRLTPIAESPLHKKSCALWIHLSPRALTHVFSFAGSNEIFYIIFAGSNTLIYFAGSNTTNHRAQLLSI